MKLDAKVEKFMERSRKENSKVTKDWPTFFESRVAGYEGGVVAKAQELTWEQVEAALPPVGMSAAVDAHNLAEGRVKEVLADPEQFLKPKELWPTKTRRGKVMAREDEAKMICIGLVKRKILRVADAKERIYDKDGNVIASGLFGLGKGVEFTSLDGRLLEILRLIINMVGPNEVIEDFEGDTSTLPYLGQWRATTLQRGEIFRWSGEDLRSAFYLLKLPRV